MKYLEMIKVKVSKNNLNCIPCMPNTATIKTRILQTCRSSGVMAALSYFVDRTVTSGRRIAVSMLLLLDYDKVVNNNNC